MYCVIQKLTNKRPNPNGAYKELIPDEKEVMFDSKLRIKYGYKYSFERFERPILDAYKISIHQAFREQGQVKKRQWSICTMDYYNLLDYRPKDFIDPQDLNNKLKEMEITEHELWEMVYQKLNPITDRVKAEFETTDEYKAMQLHKKLLKAWRLRKTLFKKSHGVDAYEYCYDFFNNEKDFWYAFELQKAFDEQQQREQRERDRQQEEERQRSNYYSNYNKSSNPIFSLKVNYTDDEKVLLKKIYRHLCKTFHPDVTQDDGKMMKLIIKLKEDWNL